MKGSLCYFRIMSPWFYCRLNSLDAGAGPSAVDTVAASGASTLAEETGVQTVPVVPAGTGTIITEPGVPMVPVLPERPPTISLDAATPPSAGAAPADRTILAAPATPPVTPAGTDAFNLQTAPVDLPVAPLASQVVDPAAPVDPITPVVPTTRLPAQQTVVTPNADVGPPFQVNIILLLSGFYQCCLKHRMHPAYPLG